MEKLVIGHEDYLNNNKKHSMSMRCFSKKGTVLMIKISDFLELKRQRKLKLLTIKEQQEVLKQVRRASMANDRRIGAVIT